MIVPDYSPFVGEHCETTAVGNLLTHDGMNLSEPLLFGLGGGLGFIYWKMKTMPVPFLGGRTKDLTGNLCHNMGLKLVQRETTSSKKAWEHVVEAVESGKPIGLQLDCYHLDYFTKKIHFAGHHVVLYGFDAHDAYLVDTRSQGGAVKTSLENLAKARSEKGPMSARNRSYRIEETACAGELSKAIPQAICRNAREYLNPPIRNLGYKGVLKTSEEIKKWLKTSKDPSSDFAHTAAMMEHAGTGGALFRNLYRDFLKEAYLILGEDSLAEAGESFTDIARKWTYVATLFGRVEGKDDTDLVEEASDTLVLISDGEKSTMTKLYKSLTEQ